MSSDNLASWPAGMRISELNGVWKNLQSEAQNDKDLPKGLWNKRGRHSNIKDVFQERNYPVPYQVAKRECLGDKRFFSGKRRDQWMKDRNERLKSSPSKINE